MNLLHLDSRKYLIYTYNVFLLGLLLISFEPGDHESSALRVISSIDVLLIVETIQTTKAAEIRDLSFQLFVLVMYEIVYLKLNICRF